MAKRVGVRNPAQGFPITGLVSWSGPVLVVGSWPVLNCLYKIKRLQGWDPRPGTWNKSAKCLGVWGFQYVGFKLRSNILCRGKRRSVCILKQVLMNTQIWLARKSDLLWENACSIHLVTWVLHRQTPNQLSSDCSQSIYETHIYNLEPPSTTNVS